MSSRRNFFDRLFRSTARLAMYPNVRDVSVDKNGQFVDVLTNERLGDPLRLDEEQMRKTLVLVNFFTIDSEPETGKMAKIAALVDKLSHNLGREVFVNSITSNPERDTPKRLDAFAKQIGAGEGWTFIRADETTYKHMDSRMNRVRGYSSGREVFYGTPRGYWGTFPWDNHVEATARRLLDSIPRPKPSKLRRAGPARRGEEIYSWSARAI